jgi:hypothetical protein
MTVGVVVAQSPPSVAAVMVLEEVRHLTRVSGGWGRGGRKGYKACAGVRAAFTAWKTGVAHAAHVVRVGSGCRTHTTGRMGCGLEVLLLGVDAATNSATNSTNSVTARHFETPSVFSALQLMGPLLCSGMQDAAEGKRVVQSLLSYLDRQHQWLGGHVLDTALAIMRRTAGDEQRAYGLYLALLKHATGAKGARGCGRMSACGFFSGGGHVCI